MIYSNFQSHTRVAARSVGIRLTAIASALVLWGCAPGEMVRNQGMTALSDSKYEEGLSLLANSVQQNPGSAQLRKDFLFQRSLIIDRLLSEAAAKRRDKQLEAAEASYRRVLGIDGNNVAARQALNEIDTDRRHERLLDDAEAAINKEDFATAKSLLNVVAVENPANVRASQLRYRIEEPALKENITGPTLNIKSRKPLTLQFRDGNLKMVLEAIARATGVNIMLDKEVRNDIKVTLFVKDTSVEETLDLLLFQNQLEKRVLGENTVLIYPATAAKAKDYQDLKIRRFALGSADAKQVQAMLKTILKVKDIFIDEKTNSVVLRDTPDVVRLAERLVLSMDRSEPEVMLEIDVMQVDRTRMMNLGVNWNGNSEKGLTWTLPTGMTLQQFKDRTMSNVSIPDLSINVNALKRDGDVNDLATPRIRVRNREKAKILVGARNPVVSSAASPSSSGGSPVYNTSVTYIETGIKVEVEPDIHPDGEVAIKLNLEVSSAGNPITNSQSGTVVYKINTNNVATLLQLKDGETQILGGLLQQKSDQSQDKIPGVGDVPIAGRLFGSTTDVWDKTELLLAITPRIIRNVKSGEADLVEMWSGTESHVKFGVPNIKAAAGAGGVVGQAGAGAGPAPVAGPAAPGSVSPRGIPRVTPGATPALAAPVPTAPAAVLVPAPIAEPAQPAAASQ
jgi:general secretion pathway protein D